MSNKFNGYGPLVRVRKMADAILAIGSVTYVSQLAEYGFKLSGQLFTFSQAVSISRSRQYPMVYFSNPQ